jgi:phage N-6-adenine-methyltransferase
MSRDTMKVHYSSATPEWATPQWLFDRLNAEFHFTLDVCATPENAKCARYFTKEQDGLAREWTGVCWMNPPYGRQVGKWVKKAFDQAADGVTTVCLLPARTDTRWFHQYCAKGDVQFIKGRLYFGDGEGRAPFPNMIVIFHGHLDPGKQMRTVDYAPRVEVSL